MVVMAEDSLIDTMRYLGIEKDDAHDQVKMNRVTDVAKYFGQFSDGMEIVRRVSMKLPKSERVDGLHNYMVLRKEHDLLASETTTEESALTEKKRRMKELRRDLETVE